MLNTINKIQKLSLGLLLICFYLVFFVVPVSAGEDDVCEIKITRNTLFNTSETISNNIADKKIYPFDESITIELEINDSNPVNKKVFNHSIESHFYGLYAVSGDKQWWVEQDRKPIMVNGSNNKIVFRFNRSSRMEDANGYDGFINRYIIPQREMASADWFSEVIQFKVVGTTIKSDLENERKNIPTHCTFSLRPTNQCNHIDGHTITTDKGLFTVNFQNPLIRNSGFLKENFSFSRFIDKDAFDVKPASGLLNGSNVLIGLNETDAPAYFNGTQTADLLYQQKRMCEFRYTPINEEFIEDLSKCSIVPEKDSDNQFSGRLTIKDFPKKILSANNEDWININSFGQNDGSVQETKTQVVFLPSSEYGQITLGNTAAQGLKKITNLQFIQSVCTDGNKCFVIDGRIDPNSITVPTYNFNNQYTAVLMYHTKRINIEEAYYMVPSCSATFTSTNAGITIAPTPTLDMRNTDPNDQSNENPPIDTKKICADKDNPNTKNINEESDCEDCLGKGSAYTAFGCLPTSIEGFFKTVVFQLGLGLAGGIAFLLMLWGSFTILISQGDPQQIQRGREIIVSAIAGLLLIIFSMVIMQFLGYNVLRIPGFGPSEEGSGNGSASVIPTGDPAFNQTYTPPTPTPTKVIPAVNPNLSISLINPSSPRSIPNNTQVQFTVIGPNVPLTLEYSVLTSNGNPYLCFPVDWKLNIGEAQDKGGVTIHTPRLNLPDGSYKIAMYPSTTDGQSTCTHAVDTTPITTFDFSIQDISTSTQCEIKTVRSGGCYVENVCDPRPNCEPVVTNDDGSMDIKCCY